jgi:hypothetical protein
MEKQETEITIKRVNVAVLLCWFAVVTGVAGLILRVVSGGPDYLWLSVVGLLAGGLGVTFGGPLKTVETRKVMLSPVRKND